MGEEAASTTKPLTESLLPEELLILNRALKSVEGQLFSAVLKRLKAWVIVATGALTIFGVASMTTLKDAIVISATSKLSADQDIRQSVIAQSAQRLAGVDEVIKKAAELEKSLEAERVKALSLLGSDLERMLKMIEQLEADAAALRGRRK